MKKRTIIILVLISIVLGVFIGTNWDALFYIYKPFPQVYPPKVPQELKRTGEAFSDIVKSVGPSVVNVSATKSVKKGLSPFAPYFEGPSGDFSGEPFHNFKSPKRWKERSLGSGVIVSPDGYIVTNYHVVEEADEIKVTLIDKRDFKGKVVGSDPKTDLAIIKIKANGLPVIPWGNSDKLQVGEFVLAIGSPFGLSHTVTMGIISAVGRANVGIADYEDFIQTDAAINPGNSGGPLVNINGELIGITTAIFSKSGGYQGIGFAVPSNMARLIMEQLLKSGKVTRGWLGVSIQEITPELGREFGLKSLKGALVSEVFRGSPAEKAGVRRGDVILEFNGKTIEDVGYLRNMVAQTSPGSSIKIKIIRDGKTINVEATIAELPKEVSEVKPDVEEASKESALVGLHIMDITQEVVKQLRLPRGEQGVVIIRVEPGSPAEEIGLKRGDVIQEINRKRINNSRDFNGIASRIKEGDTLLLYVNRGGKKFYVTLKAYS
ncbi:MAG: DegQ family serine endoprotease [Nitrospirae bacterium]|nr:DegQ family serine endoprotease [Nitrospirota bacterium]